jgi:hAT family C-terminal dimerisation region
LSANDPRHQAITKRIGEMIAADMQPLSIVENIGFKRLLNVLEPRYKIPSRSYFTRTVIPDMYAAVRAKIQLEVDKAEFVSFTTDIWTNDNNVDSFLGLTAHWIDDNWCRKSVVLEMQPLESRHTGEVIAETIRGMIDKWHIDQRRTGVFVRDNGSSMVKAARLLGVADLGCYIHTTQLVVNDGLKSQCEVLEVIGTCRSIVGHFRHSTQATAKLEAIQKSLGITDDDIIQHRLIQDVPTRWNSTFYMLERLLEQKKAVSLYTLEANIPILDAHQWNFLEQIVHTLRPFEEETRTASLATSTASMIIPSARLLMRFLQADDAGNKFSKVNDLLDIRPLRFAIYDSMSTRFVDIDSNKICSLATILDPYFKTFFFATDAAKNQARKWLLEETKRVQDQQQPTQPTASARNETVIESDIQVQPCTSSKSVLANYWAEFANSHTPQNTESIDYQQEVERYLTEPLKQRCDPLEDPVVYWKQRALGFPLVSKVARKYLATPPSSVSSERMFSTAGDVATEKRSCLLPKHTEMLLFLAKNLPFCNFNY